MKRSFHVIAVLALAVIAGLLIREYVVGVTVVAGESMNDTLVTGDVALMTRYDYFISAPQRGDVVQIEVPGRDGYYLKRVIGLPGERVEIRGGAVYIDGELLYEDYITPSYDDYSVTLYADEYFVLGDNRPVSYDSREEDFGAVSAACFRGRVRAVIWPPERISFGID